MIIRESDGQLDISGSPAELASLAAAIEELGPGEPLHATADAAADPRPYRRCLAGLDVRVTNGPVIVGVQEDRVVITAGPELLSALASYFRFPTDAPRGMHNHHEWFEGNEYISRESLPMVVSVR